MKNFSVFIDNGRHLKNLRYSEVFENYIRNDINCIPLNEVYYLVLENLFNTSSTNNVDYSSASVNLSYSARDELEAHTWSRGHHIYSADDFTMQALDRLKTVEEIFKREAFGFRILNDLKTTPSEWQVMNYERIFISFFDFSVVAKVSRNCGSTPNVTIVSYYGVLAEVNNRTHKERVLAMIVVKKEWMLDVVYRLVNNLPIKSEALSVVFDKEFDTTSYHYQGLRRAFNNRVMPIIVDNEISVGCVDNIVDSFMFKISTPNFLTIGDRKEWLKEVVKEFVDETRHENIPTEEVNISTTSGNLTIDGSSLITSIDLSSGTTEIVTYDNDPGSIPYTGSSGADTFSDAIESSVESEIEENNNDEERNSTNIPQGSYNVRIRPEALDGRNIENWINTANQTGINIIDSQQDENGNHHHRVERTTESEQSTIESILEEEANRRRVPEDNNENDHHRFEQQE